MASDLYMTDDGDLSLSPGGDLAVTPSSWRFYAQQAYLRLMTNVSDFTLYPLLGADLERLVGMPQTASTGEMGKQLILAALNREGVFNGIPVDVKPVPVSFQSIRFDVYITAGSRSELILSIEQNLGLDQ